MFSQLAPLEDDRRQVADDDRLPVPEPGRDDDRKRLFEAVPRLGETAGVVQHRRQLDELNAFGREILRAYPLFPFRHVSPRAAMGSPGSF